MLSTPLIAKTDYDKIYEPAEDSFLLLDLFEEIGATVANNKPRLVVELGTGSGIVSTFLNQHILKNAFLIATDINPHCCHAAIATNAKNAATVNFDSIQGDLTSSLRPASVDLLIFNPPYVPSPFVPTVPESAEDQTWLDLALDGGNDGMAVTNRLLQSLGKILAPKGQAYILFCARNNPSMVAEQFLKDHPSFRVEKMIERKAGWEVLSVYLFQNTASQKDR
ncbi:uncharacterized protein OGAPODRAFT_23895 [Ogataea polymorpha]|uniref:uncharacterized protein n=1 Tax=Ogataea polymorpha TaxID=460523 RepID=UPI0007F527B4|nr:uncharacterized protein OGAPODRAFT_23895 [Ogataea polymorpha]OBA16572.1 hypothetical protein OGAPODRAFT_23895 [Ogataea polymorpha]